MVQLKRLVYDARYGKGHGETEELYKGVRSERRGANVERMNLKRDKRSRDECNLLFYQKQRQEYDRGKESR